MEKPDTKARHLLCRHDAFTLPEVLIALAVLTIALLGMAALTGSLVSAGALHRGRITAITLAQSKIEEFKNLPYSSLENQSDGEETQGIFVREWTVSENVPTQDMTTITVEVSWPWHGSTKKVVLPTIRSE